MSNIEFRSVAPIIIHRSFDGVRYFYPEGTNPISNYLYTNNLCVEIFPREEEYQTRNVEAGAPIVVHHSLIDVRYLLQYILLIPKSGKYGYLIDLKNLRLSGICVSHREDSSSMK